MKTYFHREIRHNIVHYFMIGLKIAIVRVIAGAIVLIPIMLLGLSSFSWINFADGTYNAKVIMGGATLLVIAMVFVELIIQGALSARLWKWF